MTAEVERRGMVRPITDLPATPGGVGDLEIEIAGAFYRVRSDAIGGGGGVSYWNQTVAQFPLDAANGSAVFTEAKGNAVTVTGTVAGSNATSEQGYGTSALYSGAGGQISIAANADLDFGSADFSLQGWFKTAQAAQQYTTLAERSNASFNSGSWALFINGNAPGNDGKVEFWQSDFSAAGPLLRSGGGFNDGAWHHLAVVRAGNQFLMFLDGAVQNRAAYAGAFTDNGTALLRLGNSIFASRALLGNLQAWQFLRGPALYTSAAFAVPTTPFATS